ncbi:MAG: 2'-5' RNA ligase family protein [Halobacteriaceae archaeon]
MRDEYGGFWPGRYEMAVEPSSGWPERLERFREHLVFSVEPGPAVRNALADAAAPVAAADAAIAAPPVYYHVTVTIAGDLVDPDTAAGPGEFDPAGLDRLRAAARDRIAALERGPFEASLPRLNVFPSVVFCEVAAGGQLATLNDALCELSGVPEHDRDLDYVPHVTLGHFRDRDIGGLLDRLKGQRQVDAPPLGVEAVTLIGMEFDQRYPERRVIERFPLS